MSDSPYAAPRARLADVIDSTPAAARPAEVALAVRCLWVTFALDIAGEIWEFLEPPARHPALPVSIATDLAMLMILAWIYTALAKGRNWARIVNFIFTGIGVLSLPVYIFNVTHGLQTLVTAVAGVGNQGIGGFACYLLLGAPAKAWYRSMKGRG